MLEAHRCPCSPIYLAATYHMPLSPPFQAEALPRNETARRTRALCLVPATQHRLCIPGQAVEPRNTLGAAHPGSNRLVFPLSLGEQTERFSQCPM